MNSIIILLIIALFFLVVNVRLNAFDIMHPSVLFCLISFVDIVICLLGQDYYQIHLHMPTILIFTAAFFIMTFSSLIHVGRRETVNMQEKIEEIYVPKFLYVLLAVFQLITIICFIRYLRAIAEWWGGTTSLTEMINLYNNMTKFWNVTIEVKQSMAFRILNPFCNAGAYLSLYILIHNFVISRKIDLFPVINVLLWCALVVLNGSRSPLFRMFTMAVFLFYIIYYKSRPGQFNQQRFLRKVLRWLLIFLVLMVIIVNFMRITSNNVKLTEYIFTYTGACIVNLDNLIMRCHFRFFGVTRPLFGYATFTSLYTWLNKYHIVAYSFPWILKRFAFSNGIEIGNVYTTFAAFVYDFGYAGVVPLFSIVAVVYVWLYKKCFNVKISGRISLSIYIYAYIFNDLCMLLFSNRFYETVVNMEFVKFLFMSIVIIAVLKCFSKLRFKSYV